jgi:Arm DNA-binding domain
MARVIGKLTALGVTQAKKRGYYSDGGGLFLQVSATGSKSWVFRFREASRLHEMGLGPTHTVTLAEARQKARSAGNFGSKAMIPLRCGEHSALPQSWKRPRL